MWEVTNGAGVNLASVAVVLGFFMLLLAATPLACVRQVVLAVSGVVLRMALIAAVIALAVWALLPAATPPSALSVAVAPMVEATARAVDCEPHLVRPFVYWWIAANVVVAGILLISILSFARLLGTHQQRLCQLLQPGLTPATRSAAARPRKKLADLL